jgi:hypothetical protein
MSVKPVLGTPETLHERPTRASEAWKTEERRTAWRRVDGVFILEIWYCFSLKEKWLLSFFIYFFLVRRGLGRLMKAKHALFQ